MKYPIRLIKGDSLEILDDLQEVKCIFADPPDNLGLAYKGFHDVRVEADYYNWLELLILKSLKKTGLFWLSFYHIHQLELMYRVRNILKYRYPSFEARVFIWRFTFGQHSNTDSGSGYRPILRFKRAGTGILADQIRTESERQRIGDSRANPKGRVPDDVFEIPRVVGNAKERRAWHPTQHPEALMDRIVRSSCLLPEGAAPNWDGEPSPRIINGNDWGNETFVDLFAGTGTSIRVCKRLGVPLITSEISDSYVAELIREHPDVKFERFDPVKSI